MAITSINGIPLESISYDSKTKVADSVEELDGTFVSGAAWNAASNTQTSGMQYNYATYDISNVGAIILLVNGASYGNNWPLITFYDNSNNILSRIVYGSQKLYDSKPASIPNGAVRCIVNGNEQKPAKLYKVNYGDKTQYHVNLEVSKTLSILSNKSMSADMISILETVTVDGSYTIGQAWVISGSPSTGPDYEYLECDISQVDADELIVSGCSWGGRWPLISFYNDNSEIVSFYGTSGSTSWYDEIVEVPSGATTCIVNGSKKAGRPVTSVKYKAVIETQEDVNNRVELILSESGIQPKKYLFIGDSYSQGYSHDGNNDGWPIYLAEYMGLNRQQYGISRRGGAGFTIQSNSFLQLLQNASGSGYTDIVVCGGFNDFNKTQAEIEQAISDFYDAAVSLYPSARVHVGAIGYIKEGSGESAYSNWQEVRTKIETVLIPSYQAAVKYGCRYLNNVEYMLGENGLTPTDGYHPSEAGNRAIALGIANALLTGSAPLPYNHDMRAQ